MMYYHWVHNQIRPSVFYNMSAGERRLINVFDKIYFEQMEKV